MHLWQLIFKFWKNGREVDSKNLIGEKWENQTAKFGLKN